MEKFREWLREKEKGAYLAVKYTQSSAEDIILFINKNNIPSDMTIDDIHSTIIYSKKYANIIINDQGEDLGYAEPLKFHIFETKEGKNALVILVKSEYLEKRHKELMEKYDLVYEHDKYIPHITISYDIGEYDISTLNIKDLPKHFTINTEYKEELDT